ncbi:hypothetical protein PCANC_27938 [Puccinia coronata f. sp. avenae]|uniref:Uncharacterized protein n=1 Tax=Puccinia coronata f. sp. avenae TaxID=200324 RepID=A0A2N5TE71_9BASI|nr:hypothetical protein PCANC_27938 [Puccinia coronata f. sp. avenae]
MNPQAPFLIGFTAIACISNFVRRPFKNCFILASKDLFQLGVDQVIEASLSIKIDNPEYISFWVSAC